MSELGCALDDIASALQYLDCCDTDVWLRAGMAIKREFGDVGFDVWDSWSQGYDRYSHKRTHSAWKSFKGGGSRGSVSIGTVLHWAFERGFKFERPELTQEQKEKFSAEQAERRTKLAQQWAQEDADIKRWYEVIADVSNRLLPLLKATGISKYLGKKRVSSCGCLFPVEPFILDFKHDFSVDVVVGKTNIDAVFTRVKNNKAAGQELLDKFLYIKRGDILIPMLDSRDNLRNFQIIFSDGSTKRFLEYGQKSGLHFSISAKDTAALRSPVVFCEGFATGASLHMATGWQVIVCFDAGNLVEVAKKIHTQNKALLFAGDNDWETALDPKKKNTGLVKAREAAAIAGGLWCIPEFVSDAQGLSDFNDLHVASGLPLVKQQLEAALLKQPEPINSTVECPPDYGDYPPSDYSDFHSSYSDSSPAPSHEARPDIVLALKRYALAMPDAKVWDGISKKVLRQAALKSFLGAKLFDEWLGHDERRTVDLVDVQREAAVAQAAGGGGISLALRRYVYLYPSSTAWDCQTRQQVSLADLRNAIADCYDQWLKHSERREIPKDHLVFDPTQQVDTDKFINMFRGLPLIAQRNDDACRNMRHMLWCLCNKDNEIFTWLCQWLAYPLQHVGAKMQTAVLMHSSVHGSGKSFFFDGVMRAIYGEYCRTFGQAELESQYNDWISQALFGVFEEVLSRSQRYSHTGTLKQMITGEKVRINQKYMQGWEESNHMNCVFLSNEVEPLPLEPSDRRLLVIWPEEKLIERLQLGVDAELKGGGATAFFAWLLSVDTSNFSPHAKPPMTEAKKRLIDIGRPAWQVFYEDWKNERTDAPYISCRVIDLYKIFQHWARQRNENILAMNRFSGYIATYEKRRQDVEYGSGVVVGKGTFFVIGRPPENKNQGEWLAGCVQEFTRILQKNSQEAA